MRLWFGQAFKIRAWVTRHATRVGTKHNFSSRYFTHSKLVTTSKHLFQRKYLERVHCLLLLVEYASASAGATYASYPGIFEGEKFSSTSPASLLSNLQMSTNQRMACNFAPRLCVRSNFVSGPPLSISIPSFSIGGVVSLVDRVGIKRRADLLDTASHSSPG